MREDTGMIAQIEARLQQVNSTFLSASRRTLLNKQGREEISGDHKRFLRTAHDLSRANPAHGVALASGAAAEANRTQNPSEIYTAHLCLALALAWWGQHYKAYGLLQSLPIIDETVSPYAVLLKRWYFTIMEARVGQKSLDSKAEMSEIAAGLEAIGDLEEANRCRLDAILGDVAIQSDRSSLPLIDRLCVFFEERKMFFDVGLCHLLPVFVLTQGTKLELTQAADRIAKAQSLCTAHELPGLQVYAEFMQATLDTTKGDWKASSQHTMTCLEQAIALQHAYYEAVARSQLARFYMGRGEFNKARQVSLELQDIAQQLSMRNLIQDALFIDCRIRVLSGDSDDETRKWVADAIKQIDSPRLWMALEVLLAVVLARQGKFSQAVDLLKSVLDRTETANYYVIGDALLYLGQIYQLFGHNDLALQRLEEARHHLSHPETIAHSVRATIALSNLLFETGGSPDQALQLLQEATAESQTYELQDELLRCTLLEAELFEASGQPEEALTGFENVRAAALTANLHVTEIRAFLGIIRGKTAIRDIESGQRLLKQINPSDISPVTRWEYYDARAPISLETDGVESALEDYQQALLILSRSRQFFDSEAQAAGFARHYGSTFSEAFQLAIDHDRPDYALYFAELYHAQLLLARLDISNTVQTGPAAFFDQIRRGFSERHGAEWTVLRYVIVEDGVYSFVITPSEILADPLNREHFFRNDGELTMGFKSLTHAGLTFRENGYPTGQPTDENIRLRETFYDHLIPDSVTQRLHPDHMLVIVPTGQFRWLSFPALIHNHEPLIVHARILYSPSLSIMAAENGPVPVPSDKEPIKGMILSQRYFEAMDTLHHAGPSTRLLEAPRLVIDHIRTEFQNGEFIEKLSNAGGFTGYQFLQWDTHAVESPSRLSLGLVVGGTVLPSEEIVRLHIPVEVAVVADCYTADNPTRSARKELDLAGDEVNHIANAFLCAGAQRVLGALWWTADEEVRYITDRFYEHYLAEGDATYALTEAIRSAISENIAPFYWASLMMFGKP